MLPLMRKVLLNIAFFIFISATFINYFPVYAEEVLKVGGTGTAIGSMKLLAAAFMKTHPDVKIIVMPSIGSSGGIRAVEKGAIDIGLASRALKGEELTLGLHVIEYSMTPLILVANENVSTIGLRTDELINIYIGKTYEWPDGNRIRLVLRPDTESDTLYIKKISPEMSNAVDIALKRSGMLIALTDQECADMVERIPGAIGFSTLTQIITENRNLNVLSYNDIFPDIKSLSERRYPLYKSQYFITKHDSSKLSQRFMEFIRSYQGRIILEESGNLPLMDNY